MLLKKSRTSFGSPSKKYGRRLRHLFSLIRKVIPEAFTLFLLFFFFILVYNLFAVRKISCSLNNENCSPEIQARLSRFLGKNVLLIKQKELISSLKYSFPIEKATIGFKIFNTLEIKLNGRSSSVSVQTALVDRLPELALDKIAVSSDSSLTRKPSEEIDLFFDSVSFTSFDIWDNGLMTPAASGDAKIKYLLSIKPEEETVRAIYKLVKLVEKYLNVDQFLILNKRIFLRQAGQPDIIVNVPFDEDTLVQALRSLAFLASVKKDAKVIDLRFKNPILR